MKKLLSLLLAFVSIGLYAQQLDEISIDARGSFHQDWTDEGHNTHFQGDYFNLHIKGHLSDNISFRVRQRMNKKIDDQNPFNATDFLWIRWQPFQHWAFTAGKQPIHVGGYEIDSAPIDVYYYGAFSSRWHQYYAFGVTASYLPSEGQTLSFQFCPSPVSPAKQNAYTYNIFWNGHIGSRWLTTWSYNYVEDERKWMMNWIALGNRFLLGPLALDVDFINRAAFGQKHFFFSDWSLIGKAILTLGNWNICTKVGYERNDAANVNAEGITYDLILPAGNDYFYGGAGVEYFPLGNDNLRLHAVWFSDSHDHIENFDIGITWRFNIYKR